MKTLVAFILLWIGAETDYNTNIPHPKILLVSESTLAKMHYGNQKAEDTVHALYNTENNTIYLKDTFNQYKVFDKGVLMHEIMHYVHDMNGAVGTTFDCISLSPVDSVEFSPENPELILLLDCTPLVCKVWEFETEDTA